MGMSAWGFLALPLLMQATEPGTKVIETTPEQLIDEMPAGDALDVFGGLTSMDDATMAGASGGADTAVDIGLVGLNASETNGLAKETHVSNSQNGQVANNVISGNDGISFQVNNSGNGVVVQNTVNINIYTGTQ